MTPLTRDEAREQVARALYIAPRVNPVDAAERWDALRAGDDTRADYLDDADAALSVLWPEVERLTRERDEGAEDDARLISRQGDLLTGVANALRGNPPPLVAWSHSALPDLAFRVKVERDEARAEVERLRAELDHAHAIIARHVEPLRKPCRPEAGDCCDGDAHTWQPSAASVLPDCVPAGAPVSDQRAGRVETRGRKDHG